MEERLRWGHLDRIPRRTSRMKNWTPIRRPSGQQLKPEKVSEKAFNSRMTAQTPGILLAKQSDSVQVCCERRFYTMSQNLKMDWLKSAHGKGIAGIFVACTWASCQVTGEIFLSVTWVYPTIEGRGLGMCKNLAVQTLPHATEQQSNFLGSKTKGQHARAFN